MEGSFKRGLGRGLLAVAEAVPLVRPWLGRWGRRTRPEWFAGRVVRARSRDGGRLRLASIGENYLSFELFWRGLDYYEPLTTWLVHALAADAGQFLDVGANIGFHSLMLAARRPPPGGIVAFEPNPKLHVLLTANVRANGFGRIRCEALALSSASGPARLYVSRSDMSASLEAGFDGQPTGAVRVQAVTLDDYAAHQAWTGRLLVKVDIEGHEAAFFAGASHTLTERRPDVIAEAAVPCAPATVALFAAAGYRCYAITDRGLERQRGPAPVVRGPLVFLNNLLTIRPPGEIAGLSDGLRAHARTLDLHATSKKADARVLEKLRARPEFALKPP